MAKTVAVLGAHSAIGEALLTALDDRALDAAIVAATTTEHVDAGHVLIDADLISRGDLFVIAFGGKVAEGVAAGLIAQGKPVLDLAGVTDAPWVFPTLADEVFAPARIAVGLAEPVAAIVRALSPFSPSAVDVTTFESAATFDRPGMDELSAQTRAVFTMQDAPAEVFAATLAFDVIPTVTGPDGEWDLADEALATAVTAACGVPADATRILVPSFSAEGAVVRLTVEGTPDFETVETALAGGKGMRYLPDEPPPTVDVVDRDDALVGRLVIRAGRITLWLAADRLRRGGASQAALWVERWLTGKIGASVPAPRTDA
ncbi:MAG: hypothetical protein RIT81_06415 [Deltaproteobacteria bacterium]